MSETTFYLIGIAIAAIGVLALFVGTLGQGAFLVGRDDDQRWPRRFREQALRLRLSFLRCAWGALSSRSGFFERSPLDPGSC